MKEYIYPVGRLDYDSEGLLLLTNDGELAARLTHPRHEVEKVYEARVKGVPDDQRARSARSRRPDRGTPHRARRRSARPSRSSRGSGEQTIVEISIHEGRQRQVSKMFEAVGHPVVRLRRVRIGPIDDPDMPPGHWRELTPQEVAKLQRLRSSQLAPLAGKASTRRLPTADSSVDGFRIFHRGRGLRGRCIARRLVKRQR